MRDLRVLFPLAGDGPWTLRLPAGEVLLDVRGEDGAPVAATVFAGDDRVGIEGPTLLRRLRPGAQQLFVAAEDRLAAVVDVVVPEAGRTAVEATLPRRN